MNYRRFIIYFAIFICLASASKNETKDKTKTKDKLDIKDEPEMVDYIIDESVSGDKQEIKKKNETKGKRKVKGKHQTKNKHETKDKHEPKDYHETKNKNRTKKKNKHKTKDQRRPKNEHRSHLIIHDYTDDTDDAKNTNEVEGDYDTNGKESGEYNINIKKRNKLKINVEKENDYGSDLEHGGWHRPWNKDINAAIVPIVIRAYIDEDLVTPGPNPGPGPVPDCLEDGISYKGNNIVKGEDNYQDTIHDCQRSCARHPECVQWTWGKLWGRFQGWCYLKYSRDGYMETLPDVVTGTKHCPTDGYDPGEPHPTVDHLIVDSQYYGEKINFIKGEYRRMEHMEEGFPVFRHARGIPFIFVNHRGQWVIGKILGENFGYAFNDQIPPPRTPPPTGWKVDLNGVWQYDDTFDINNGGEPHPEPYPPHPEPYPHDYSDKDGEVDHKGGVILLEKDGVLGHKDGGVGHKDGGVGMENGDHNATSDYSHKDGGVGLENGDHNEASDYSHIGGGVGLDTGDTAAAPVIIKTDIGPRIPLDGASLHQISAKIKTFIDQTIPRGHGGADYQQEEKH